MDIGAFYSVVASTCFILLGLWWSVVKDRADLLKDAVKRDLAFGVFLSFLIPGAMSLLAQVGGEARWFWRLIFAIAALLGIIFTLRLIVKTPPAAGLKPGFFRRNRWVVAAVYLLILVFAIVPGLAEGIGLQGLQVEAIMLSLLVIIAHGLAWDFMTEPPSQ